MSKIKGDINREMLGYAEEHTGDCYGDGTVYRGQRSKDSAAKTIQVHASDCARHSEPAYPAGECDCRAQISEEEVISQRMMEVAEKYAHRLALDLECILLHYSGPWYGDAMRTLEAYRREMRDIHEDICPTFMGEPLETKK